MDHEKQYTEGIHLEKHSKEGRFDNFWYHYKWPTIGIVIFLLIFGICIAQSCSREEEDILLLYAGSAHMSATEKEGVHEALTAAMPYDLNGDGKRILTLVTYNVYSAEQIAAILAENSDATFDTARNSSEYSSYQSHITKGEGAIYFLDPWLYESLRKDSNQPLQKLSDVFSELPKGALEDGYGVRLGDTDLYERYEVLKSLPPDTVVCFSRPYVMGKISKDKYYRREKEMLAALLGAPLKEME